MNLSHEGTGGIDLDEIAILCLTTNFGRHAVSAEHDRRPDRNFVHGIDKRHAAINEAVYHVAVVYDLVEDVDRRPLHVEDLVDTVNGHVDARTKPARVTEENFDARH